MKFKDDARVENFDVTEDYKVVNIYIESTGQFKTYFTSSEEG